MSLKDYSQYARGVRLRTSKTKSGARTPQEKAVLQVTREIYKLRQEQRRLRARLKAITKELRAQNRALRIVLQ